jgi:tartrate-resistant acid phosphatase type 5
VKPPLLLAAALPAVICACSCANGDDIVVTPPTALPTVEAGVTRFIAMGDGGEGNDTQYAVSRAVEGVCEASGCDFVLYMGDNIYSDGAESPTDPMFESRFELPYENLDLPFYVVLGNHDYGGNSAMFWRAQHEIDYTEHSEKWNMPSAYYTFRYGDVQLFGLDTNALMWGISNAQEAWFSREVAASEALWKVAYGHHPYRSNGRHGNAGDYEGLSHIPVASGNSIRRFFEERMCGEVDLYLCGHDHNRQWIDGGCRDEDGEGLTTELIVSGTAAKTTDLADRGNPVHFENDEVAGFVWVEATSQEITAVFYDEEGAEEFRRVVGR